MEEKFNRVIATSLLAYGSLLEHILQVRTEFLKSWLRFLVSTSIFTKKQKQKKKLENFESAIFQLFFVPMCSGISGIDSTSNI